MPNFGCWRLSLTIWNDLLRHASNVRVKSEPGRGYKGKSWRNASCPYHCRLCYIVSFTCVYSQTQWIISFINSFAPQMLYFQSIHHLKTTHLVIQFFGTAFREIQCDRYWQSSESPYKWATCLDRWVEISSGIFSPNVNHGNDFKTCRGLIEFFRTHSQFFIHVLRIVVRQWRPKLCRNAVCNS